MPVFRTREEVDKMKVGEVLEVLADDPASEPDIKAWARTAGQELLSFSKEGDKNHFLIRKVK